MNLLTRHALAATLAALAWGASGGKAGGATIQSASVRPAHEALGAAQEETVWFEGIYNGNFYHASGILIRGLTSDWVLTAGHVVGGNNGSVSIASMTVGNGSSYISDRGQTSAVSEVILSPTYVGTNLGAGGDFVFLRLTTRISSPTLYFSLAAAVPSFNQELLFAGFGDPISLAEGALPNTGNVMGFTSLFSTSQPTFYDPALYDSGQFFGSATGIGSSSDSGGSVKVWNATTGRYDLVGMMVASNSSATFYFNFNEASFTDILTNTIKPVTAPLPVLTLTSTGTAMHLAWDATAAGFRLQTNDGLGSAGWTYLGPVITAPGTYDDPIASRPRQFYRLAKP